MDLSALARIAGAAPEVASKLEKLKKTSQDIESIFLKDLLAIMRKSVRKTEESMPGMDIYEDMYDQALAESAAKSGTFGIGSMLYKQLKPSVEREAWIAAFKSDRSNKSYRSHKSYFGSPPISPKGTNP